MAFIQEEARRASALLGEKRGNFPAYKGSRFDHPDTPYMRNATDNHHCAHRDIEFDRGHFQRY